MHLVEAGAAGHDLIPLARDRQGVIFLPATPAHASACHARELGLRGVGGVLAQDLLGAVTDAFWDVVVLFFWQRDAICAVDKGITRGMTLALRSKEGR